MRSDARRCLAPLAFVAMQVAAPSIAAAQTRFLSPGDRVDYSHYTLPEQCNAAVARVTASERFQERRDTLPYNAAEPIPAAAVEVARRCIANFSVDRVDTTSLRAFRDLALSANQDSLAERAVAREFANARGDSLAARAHMLLDAVQAGLSAHPVRVDLARRLIAQLDRLGPQAAQERFGARSVLLQMLQSEMREVAGMLQLVNEMTELVQHVPPGQRAANPQAWQMAENVMRLAYVWITELRDGPAAGLAELRVRGWDAGTVLGRRAPAIESPYWYNRPDEAPRPRAGKLSLVVFVDPSCTLGCFPNYATLRRLGRAHPELEITLVAPTHGFFGKRLTTRAADEAELSRQYFLGYHQLPGALAVDSTPFIRFDTPDGRRVNGLAANNANYGGTPVLGVGLTYFLVGPDGIIDFNGLVIPEQEQTIEAEIAAIKRSTGLTQAAP